MEQPAHSFHGEFNVPTQQKQIETQRIEWNTFTLKTIFYPDKLTRRKTSQVPGLSTYLKIPTQGKMPPN
ncbi:unnamed protein product [Allacma fusca]|uniref:Uncharacterized protein n=1 Tax=Allacma fusca TaxID=39272 RepID=A0A8J2NUC5_9HEXA|nr:unnamed protein product [Allacma fusca]